MDRRELSEWLGAYERAWRTPGTESLRELFARDASYRTAPYEQPYRGLEAISEMWERERASADEAFEISAEVIAAEDRVGVARVEVHYHGPPRVEYRDLWVVRLDESGRCVEFEEWPFWPPGQEGHWPPGPQAPARTDPV